MGPADTTDPPTSARSLVVDKECLDLRIPTSPAKTIPGTVVLVRS